MPQPVNAALRADSEALSVIARTREMGGPAVVVVATDQAMAERVGTLLARHRRGAGDRVDATVVATAIAYGGGLVLTSNPDDLETLADGLVGVVIQAVRR